MAPKLITVDDKIRSGHACLAMALGLPLYVVESFMPKEDIGGTQIQLALGLHRRLRKEFSVDTLTTEDIAIVCHNTRWVYVYKGIVYDPMGWGISFESLKGKPNICIGLNPDE